jgi:hypothetical protein
VVCRVSGDQAKLAGGLGPGDVLTVGLPRFEAVVKDPDLAVGELAKGLVVGLAAGPQRVVVAPGAG